MVFLRRIHYFAKNIFGQFGTNINDQSSNYKPTKHEYFINNNIKIIDIHSQIYTSLFIDNNGNGYMCGLNYYGMSFI